MFKIISTVGPTSSSQKTMQQLQRAGSTSLRINLSHSNKDSLKKILAIFEKANIKPAIDTQGAQLRIHEIGDTQTLNRDDNITISSPLRFNRKKHTFSINHPEVISQLDEGDILKIDFGGAICKVISIAPSEEEIQLKVESSGEIILNRAIDAGSKRLQLEPFTSFDKEALALVKSSSPEEIYVSFCNSHHDIEQAKKIIEGIDTSWRPRLIAKIETIKGVSNLEEICNEADGILVDRGDLSREIKISRVPIVTSNIIEYCRQLGKECYIATNVLDSMIENQLPSRAEISDIYNLIEKGVSGIVLAAEVAIGKNPVECVRVVKYMHDVYQLNRKGIVEYSEELLKKDFPESLAMWL